jgi:hypothetical protein
MLFIVYTSRKSDHFDGYGKTRTLLLATTLVGVRKMCFCDQTVTINHGRYDGENERLQALSCQDDELYSRARPYIQYIQILLLKYLI